jgi:hypothetical protein
MRDTTFFTVLEDDHRESSSRELYGGRSPLFSRATRELEKEESTKRDRIETRGCCSSSSSSSRASKASRRMHEGAWFSFLSRSYFRQRRQRAHPLPRSRMQPSRGRSTRQATGRWIARDSSAASRDPCLPSIRDYSRKGPLLVKRATKWRNLSSESRVA